MSAYRFASTAQEAATLAALGTGAIATAKQTLYQQIIVGCATNGGSTPPADEWILATGFWRDVGVWEDDDVWID